MQQTTTEVAVIVAQEERRKDRRVKISRPLLVRPSDPKHKEEVHSTLNASRDGLYFTTKAEHYHFGMRLCVIFGYAPTDRCSSVSSGKVVRIDRLEDGSFGIAVEILVR